MGLRANFDRSYLWRYWVIILMGLGSAAWFFYDATIGYPKKVKIAQAWEGLADLESGPRAERWRELAAEKGWSQEVPVKPAKEIEESIRFQYIYGAIASLVGAGMLGYLLIARNSWVEETATGLTTSWGQSVDFTNVTKLNKRRGKDKGIARVVSLATGQKSQCVCAEFTYVRTAIGQLLERLESQLPADGVFQPESAQSESTQSESDSAEDPESEDS
ncbi:MAG: hypothetical protein ACK6DB_13705 [Planctomycetota bacterium]